MSGRHAPRLAIALLEHFVPESAPLAGDLIEDFERRQSSGWLWWQVLAAIAVASRRQSVEIRPLQLVDHQPADAVERSQRIGRRLPAVNLGASPLPGVGGLSLVLLAFHVTLAVPGLWWLLLGSTLAGVVLGLVLILVRERRPATTQLHVIHSSS